jgi:hypothetical protein
MRLERGLIRLALSDSAGSLDEILGSQLAASKMAGREWSWAGARLVVSCTISEKEMSSHRDLLPPLFLPSTGECQESK